jgi:hypothetical protein
MLLSLLNCLFPEREAVLASSECFMGKRYYDLSWTTSVQPLKNLAQGQRAREIKDAQKSHARMSDRRR